LSGLEIPFLAASAKTFCPGGVFASALIQP
jgi:hypothetical protein